MKKADCHPEKAVQARGLCKNCYDKWLKQTNKNYCESQKQNTKKWVKKNKEKAQAIAKRYNDKQSSKDVKYFTSAKRNYGISENEIKEMIRKQDNKCALCKDAPTKGKRLHIDHDHKTGRVRGLLCFSCNWFMSKIDNIDNFIVHLMMYPCTDHSTYMELRNE